LLSNAVLTDNSEMFVVDVTSFIALISDKKLTELFRFVEVIAETGDTVVDILFSDIVFIIVDVDIVSVAIAVRKDVVVDIIVVMVERPLYV
jgi:hypothetical protein